MSQNSITNFYITVIDFALPPLGADVLNVAAVLQDTAPGRPMTPSMWLLRMAAHVKLLVFIHGNAGRAGGLDIHLGQLFAAEQNLRLVVAGVGDDLRRSASAAVEKKKSQEKALCIRIFVALTTRPPNLHFLNHHRSRPGLNEALR